MLQVFAIEVTIQTLSNVSRVSIDEIWLYSVELFERQVKFFDLKIEAEHKEMEEERKIQDAISTAKNKSF